MKNFIFPILLLMALYHSSAAAAEIGIFAAVGANFQPGESIRVSYDEYEFGILAASALGFVKKFKSNNKFATFGLAAGAGSGGIFASMGLEYEMFWGLHIRGELYALNYASGFSRGRGLLGISYYF